MRRVKLTCAMKTDEPPIVGDKDDKLTLPDYAAAHAVMLGNAIYLDSKSFENAPTRAELEAQEIEIKKREDLIPENRTVLDPADLVGEDDRAEAEKPKRPYGNAPKSAWARYAVAVDQELTRERAEGMTKADLMSRYGSRLGEEDE